MNAKSMKSRQRGQAGEAIGIAAPGRGRVLVAILASCLVASALSGVAAAQSDQLYLLGVTAAAGSISADGSGVDVVYLRWDSVEGELPADVTQLRLERDGTETLATFSDPHGVADPGTIAGFYAESGMDRRRKETARWLDQKIPSATVTTSNLQTFINQLIDPDPLNEDFDRFWAIFASRVDINVARARWRAYIDDQATPGLHVYALYASNGITEVRVGEVEVNVGVRKPMPQAVGFDRVPLGRCDAPEAAKDHGAIALSWEHPGSTVTDRYGAALMISGYDLYALKEPAGLIIPGKDIAAIAAGVAHDADGNVALPDLIKLNDQPVAIAATPPDEGLHRGYNDPWYHVIISAPEVKALGFEPGDAMALYLVARDYTGNYGETVGKRIVIPDKSRPPAPWSISTQAKTFDSVGSEEMRVVWDEVNVLNYKEDYALDRVYCNLETARFDKELRYVPEGGDCEADPQIVVDLNVTEYRVYRFESQGQAMRFQDSDGDGFSDEHERTPIPGLDPEFTNPADACDPSVVPADPTLNRLVDTVVINTSPDHVQRPSGRWVMQYIDTDIAQQEDTIYWYRVASFSPDGSGLPNGGKRSELSAPGRGLYHDRDLPQRDDCRELDLVSRDCSYYATLIQPDPPADPVTARDETTAQAADYIVVSCTNPVNGLPVSEMVPMSGGAGVDRTATLDRNQCDAVISACLDATDLTTSFYDEDDVLLGSVDLPPGSDLCPLGTAVLQETCRETPIVDGSTLSEPPVLTNPCGPDLCTSIYQEIGGKSYKVGMHCPPDPFPPLKFPGMSGEICLSYTLHDQNNNVSAKTYFPCFHLPSLKPDAPQAVAFTFEVGTTNAAMTFVPPEQYVAGTLLEWSLAGESTVTTVFNAHEGQTSRDGLRSQPVVLTTPAPVGEEQEEWCFRGRSVTRDGKLSDWSPKRCDLRLPPNVPIPEYMPWPKFDVPASSGADLQASYLAVDERMVVRMGDPVTSLNSCEITFIGESCTGDLSGSECIPDPAAGSLSFTCDDFCAELLASRTEPISFVAYRQWGDAPGDPTPSEFQQVSPLIDMVGCFEFPVGPPYGSGQGMIDPFFKMIEFIAPHPWSASGYQMVFLDRAPHVEGRWYRYQFVYFDGRGEIESYRNTNWVQAQ